MIADGHAYSRRNRPRRRPLGATGSGSQRPRQLFSAAGPDTFKREVQSPSACRDTHPGGRALVIVGCMADRVDYDPNTSNEALHEESRRGRPTDLFWFWTASGLTVACTPAGILIAGNLGSLWASIVAVVVGLAVAGIVLAIVSLAGLRTGRATMALSADVFGARGNLLPLLISFLILMGWCAIISVMVVYGVETILQRFGVRPDDTVRLIILIIFELVLVLLVWFGYRIIQITQRWIALGVGVCCLAMGAYAAAETDWSASIHSTLAPSAWLASVVIALTNGASGWWNAGADFSRFLPRQTSPRSAALATASGEAGVVLVVLLGVLVYFYRPSILHATNPIDAATHDLPLPIVLLGLVIVILGLHASAVTNLYSASLNLNTFGFRSRLLSVSLGSALVLGIALWVLFASNGFYNWFSSFLTVLGVPLAAWTGVFLVPVLVGRRWPAPGRSVVLGALMWLVVGMGMGFGFLQSDTAGMRWVGYFSPNSAFSAAGGGVLVAIVVAFAGAWLSQRWWLSTGRTVETALHASAE